VSIVEALENIWNIVLHVTSLFVIPDWGALIKLLPVFLMLGVIGPFLTFVVLGAVIYRLRRPRVASRTEDGPRVAALDAGGEPVFPPGLPHCRRDRLIYGSGARRCDICHEELSLTCPMCSLGRSALLDVCGNCGLVLRIEPRALVTVSRGGPKAGGAAVA
jgi:hypothetical protein